MKTLTGVIHGNTIELREPSGLAEGELVEISVRVIRRPKPNGGEVNQNAEAVAEFWTAEDDRILAEIARERETAQHRDLPE